MNKLVDFFKGKSNQFKIGISIFAILLIATLTLSAVGFANILSGTKGYTLVTSIDMNRVNEPEDDYEEGKCEIAYESADKSYSTVVTYTYEEWLAVEGLETVKMYLYLNEGTGYVVLENENADRSEIARAVRNSNTKENAFLLTVITALAMLTVSVGVVVFFGNHFTMYEKVWFLSILGISAIVAVLFPESDINGISGLLIMALYLADTFLNILCELLISKQSKWNFIVSVFVEIVEIAVCVVLAYRFATMAITLFFWLPCDIISFINWNKKKDENDEELTKVRTLKGWQELLLITGIIAWTVVVGTFLCELDIMSDIFGGNVALMNVVAYLDALASAVGVMNGLAILFRFREQWIAWYICAALEAAMNIMLGQWVLLVLKAGYITNTTYGYIKWTGYIKDHPEVLEERSIL